MPYTVKTTGMKEVQEMLETLAESAPKAAASALYDGAGTMRNEMETQAKLIRTAPFKYASGGETRLPSPEEKAIVEKGAIGVAKFQKDDDGCNTSVGFSRSGYAMLAGRLVPIPLIANSINSGTSFMNKQPFVRKAKTAGGKKAVDVMKKSITDYLEKKTGGK